MCDPVDQISVQGPAGLYVSELGIYTASHAPLTATLPVSFTWDNGTVGTTAVYSWTLPGTHTLTVTVTNPCGQAVGTFAVKVDMVPYRIYFPLVVRSG